MKKIWNSYIKKWTKRRNPTLLMKKPEELNEDKLSELTNFIIEDLKKLMMKKMIILIFHI